MNLDNFRFRKDTNNYTGSCNVCWKQYQSEFYTKNSERIKQRDAAKREHIRQVKREYMRQKRQRPEIKIYSSVSRQIHTMITSQKSSKGGRTFQKYVDWSIDQLKQHLESLFEPWMTWDNYGKYKASTWQDQDSKTWTWQIDHIVPQSNLPYTSMDDDNFKKCWSLDNLRPLNAKKNVIEGVKRIRHGSKNVYM